MDDFILIDVQQPCALPVNLLERNAENGKEIFCDLDVLTGTAGVIRIEGAFSVMIALSQTKRSQPRLAREIDTWPD